MEHNLSFIAICGGRVDKFLKIDDFYKVRNLCKLEPSVADAGTSMVCGAVGSAKEADVGVWFVLSELRHGIGRWVVH